MAHRVTMSALPRFMVCRGSEFLPHVATQPDSDAARDRARGNAIHDFVLLGKEPPEDYRKECLALDVSAAPTGEVATEVAYAYDWRKDTARVLGRALGREYPAGDELCGTADWVRLDALSVAVPDLKTGRTTREEARWQLVGLGLAASRAHGRDSAEISIIHVIDGALVQGGTETLGPLDLATAAAEIEEAFSAPPTLDVVEGPHCRHCPAFTHCPAKAGLARSMMGMPELVLNDSTVPRILDACDSAEKLVKRVKTAAREYVKRSPIHLPNGSVLAIQEVETETIIAEKARAVLPPALFDAAVEYSISKDALTAAVKESNCGTPASVLKELREAGAMRPGRYDKLKTIKPPKSAALPECDEASHG